MWTYQQSSGKLKRGDKVVATGYSGSGRLVGMNNPSLQWVNDVGPIPRGLYEIQLVHPFGNPPGKGPATQPKWGPFTMRLSPVGHNAAGRSGFLIHGDSRDPGRTGDASNGCIILPPAVREQIWKSGDHRLMVEP